MTTNFFSPLSFVAVFGSGIRDKHPGSATLNIDRILYLFAPIFAGGRGHFQQRRAFLASLKVQPSEMDPAEIRFIGRHEIVRRLSLKSRLSNKPNFGRIHLAGQYL
jgi:hypothetical protein